MGAGQREGSLSVMLNSKIDVMSYRVGVSVSELPKTCSKQALLGQKWSFLDNFATFRVTSTDILDVSMSVKPDMTGHEKCPNVLLGKLGSWKRNRA